MHEWRVAGAVVEADGHLLLVRNRRRNGRHDWSPPGGVIELEGGESVLDGLAREVLEETGLSIRSWGPRLYEVEATAPGLGWVMRAEVWLAGDVEGVLAPDDPDGIVVEAGYVALAECAERLAEAHDWVREPLVDWLTQRWDDERTYRYHVEGTVPGRARITRR